MFEEHHHGTLGTNSLPPSSMRWCAKSKAIQNNFALSLHPQFPETLLRMWARVTATACALTLPTCSKITVTFIASSAMV